MRGLTVCISLILFIQVVALAAADTPISFYDPTTKQNRPLWWIQPNSPSLFYSTAHIESVSKDPLFIKANEGKLEALQSVIDKQKDSYSLADVRRLQGLQLIEKGDTSALNSAQNIEPSSQTGVVGAANQRFTWNTERGVVGKYRTPVGLVGFLANVFSESKDERHRVRSTYYLSEDKKEVSQKEE